MNPLELVRHGGERLRTGPWHGDERVAYLAPVSAHPPPSEAVVRHSLDVLAARGVRAVVTGALAPGEQPGFLAAGFSPREELHLLAHDLVDVGPARTPPPYALRRARRGDRAPALVVDARAFPDFWRLDDAGLQEALTATPSRRFRVAEAPGHRVAGYAVGGRAGLEGYLQRLAVDPDDRRCGLGGALVGDVLWWLRRRGARRAVVNTQVGNDGAVALYLRIGFRLQRDRLTVLVLDLGGGPLPATGGSA